VAQRPRRLCDSCRKKLNGQAKLPRKRAKLIKDERQYWVTRAQAEKFGNAIREMESAPEGEPLPSILRQAQIDGLRSQLSELREELEEYERSRVRQ